MKLTKKQTKEIKKLIPYFETLEDGNIDQSIGGTFSWRDEEELNKYIKECGVCFGVHLANFYKIVDTHKEEGMWNHRFIYEDGRAEFLKRLKIWTSDQADELYSFMKDCGVSSIYPFGVSKWELHPAQVLKNMLEKGA